MTPLDPVVSSVLEDMAASVAPLESALTLPPAAYTSPQLFEFERRAVFGSSWIMLCHQDQVSEPGSYMAVEVAGEPLIITCDEDGALHALSGVCRHRGYVIADGKGAGRHLRCPYHAWTYGLDGRLVGAPTMGEVHDLDRLRAGACLPSFRLEVWEGLVFVNLDRAAGPLAPTLARLEEVLRPYRMEQMVVADTLELTGLPFNWKNMQENALEEYHTSYVHKGYHDNAPAHLVRHGDFEPWENGIYRYAGLVIPGGEPVPGRPLFPVIDGLPGEYRRFFVFAAVPPSMFAALRPDGVKLFSILPEAEDRTTLRISFLFPRSTTEMPNFDRLMESQRALVEKIDYPDLETNARTYRGLRSEFAPRGRYSPQERTLLQFNRWLLDRYTVAVSVPA